MNLVVDNIPASEAKPWLIHRHYAHRVPPINYAFGLFDGDTIIGVCTFGVPASRFEMDYALYELNRLVIRDGGEANEASYFVSRCLKLMPESIIVSYADPNNGHVGYVYQATNWVYTGLSSAEHIMIIDGFKLHRKTCYNMYGTSSIPDLKKKGHKVEIIPEKAKHRYFYVRSKKSKEILAKNYVSQKYPKGETKRYDAEHILDIQKTLF